eukprot:GDKJ01037636.1.p1 GENE.GDKJ01037636.1~~GDKJ01037636.1.p1  ORF type:complete len:302 (+),score=66.40 GDKJ01037636.1:54-959(+)
MDFDIFLHPLALLSIADHKIRAQMNLVDIEDVVGMLLGKKSESSIEIFHTFDVLSENNSAKLDGEFLKTRAAQYKEIYPNMDVVGWYATTSFDHYSQVERAKIIGEESLFVHVLNDQSSSKLPVSVYQHTKEGVLSKIAFSLSSTSPEYISLSDLNSTTKNVSAHEIMSRTKKSFADSVSMMIEELSTLKKLVAEPQTSQEALRSIKSLCLQMTAKPHHSLDLSFSAADEQKLRSLSDFVQITATVSAAMKTAQVCKEANYINRMLCKEEENLKRAGITHSAFGMFAGRSGSKNDFFDNKM